jgi:hypothetical protein
MSAPQLHPWTLTVKPLCQVTRLPSRALRNRERTAPGFARFHQIRRRLVSDSGSRMGAAGRCEVRQGAVSLRG